jgi:hypothetical protein
MRSDFGGHCATLQEAIRAKLDPAAEVLTVQLTHDGGLAGFSAASVAQPARTSIMCIRPRAGHRHMLVPAFGAACAEDIDVPLLQEYNAQVRIISGCGYLSICWLSCCLLQEHCGRIA